VNGARLRPYILRQTDSLTDNASHSHRRRRQHLLLGSRSSFFSHSRRSSRHLGRRLGQNRSSPQTRAATCTTTTRLSEYCNTELRKVCLRRRHLRREERCVLSALCREIVRRPYRTRMIMGLFSCDITPMRVPWVRLVGPLRRTLVPLFGVNARRLAR
jgi:hypothetical protein